MKRAEWRKELGELVRDAMRSPELDYYFKVKITKPGAQVLITQLGLFIHHRRDCWSHVSGNCPHMSVKQKFSSTNTARSSKTITPSMDIWSGSSVRGKRLG